MGWLAILGGGVRGVLHSGKTSVCVLKLHNEKSVKKFCIYKCWLLSTADHLLGPTCTSKLGPIKAAPSHLQKASLFTQWVRPKLPGLLSHPWFMLPLTQPSSWVIILSRPGKGQWLPHLLLPLLPSCSPAPPAQPSTALTFCMYLTVS